MIYKQPGICWCDTRILEPYNNRITSHWLLILVLVSTALLVVMHREELMMYNVNKASL